MVRHTVGLTIEGTVDMQALSEILHHLQALLDALACEVAPGVPIRWIVQYVHTENTHALE